MAHQIVLLRQNVKDKLSNVVCDETLQDIEDFLAPRFDVDNNNMAVNKNRRPWKIVRDGHGIWREIKPHSYRNEQEHKEQTKRYSRQYSTSKLDNKLFLNRPTSLNTITSTNSKPASAVPHRDYSVLSTSTRSNIFPGVGNYGWHSHSNVSHALKLGKQKGCDRTTDEFYGITRDAMGAWNEASVQHERMKKSWDAYLASRGSKNHDT